jgi:D-sedoheptulose 7-phosphate isomerase
MMSAYSEYLARLNTALNSINTEVLEHVVDLIQKSAIRKSKIWIIGNGGSASTASHFATDLSRCSNKDGFTISAVSLCDNTAQITAIGNDFGFEKVFSRQLSVLSSPRDLLFTISASGNSENILNAIEFSKQVSMTTISLSGFDGGLSARLSDYSLLARTNLGDYAVAEDSHSILCHYISQQLRT